MRILVCGAAGVIGAAVVCRAAAGGDEVHALVRNSTTLDRLEQLADSLHLHRVTLGDMPAVTKLLRQVNPDAVVQAARVVGKDSKGTKSELLMQSAEATLSLVEALADIGFRGALVLFGSAMVYGDGATPRTPLTPMEPVTFPGLLKAIDSLIVGQAARQTGMTASELRVFSAYGPYDNRDRLVSRLMAAALTDATLDLTAAPARRDWVHLHDIADACLAACAATHRGFVIRNICTGRTRSNHEVAALVSALAGRNLVGPGTYDAPDHYAISDPVGVPSEPSEGFDWMPGFDLEAGLRETFAWAKTPAGGRYLGLA